MRWCKGEGQTGNGAGVFGAVSPLATLSLIGCAIGVWFFFPLSQIFEYQRVSVAHGQWYRLLTDHFTHWSANHLFWDGMAFLCLGVMCEFQMKRKSTYIFMLIVSAVLVSVSVLLFLPELDRYRGLSGLCAAQFTFLAGNRLKMSIGENQRRSTAFVLLALVGIAAKITYEFVTGEAIFVQMSSTAGYVVVPLAHLVGGAVGLAFGICATSPGSGEVAQACPGLCPGSI